MATALKASPSAPNHKVGSQATAQQELSGKKSRETGELVWFSTAGLMSF